MTAPLDDLVVRLGTSVRDALAPLDRAGTGFLMVTDADGCLAGVVTDGDIRRAILRGVSVDRLVDEVMTSRCVSLPVEATTAEIQAALRGTIAFIPLVDAGRRPVDYARPGRHRRVPIVEPLLDGNELEYVRECVETGWISSQGRFVARFEQAVSEYHGGCPALAVSNGTVALHLALVALGIGPGDEVIVPTLTFAASASVILHAGATPVFVDVDPVTWTMSADVVAAAITPRTRAIMAVHLYGQPCEIGRLRGLADASGLMLIEDAAEAFGALSGGRLTGTFGDAAGFSFFGNKTLTTGEGGIVLFRDPAVAARARVLRDHGMAPDRRYWHLEAGFNYRLTNLQAAIGVAQMERVVSILARKRALAQRYDAALVGIPALSLPARVADTDPVCWLYTLALTSEARLSRDELASRLLQNGIETRPVFHPLHHMPPFAPFARGAEFPVADRISAAGFSLPSAVTLQPDDIDAVAASVRTILGIRGMAVSAGSVP